MTQVRKQIYVSQGYGRNQTDDAALVFTLHRKNLLTSERCAWIYQFAKFKKFLEIRDFGWRSLLITIICWIADAPLSCNLCIQEKSFGCTVFWEIRAAAKFPYFSNYSARISHYYLPTTFPCLIYLLVQISEFLAVFSLVTTNTYFHYKKWLQHFIQTVCSCECPAMNHETCWKIRDKIITA